MPALFEVLRLLYFRIAGPARRFLVILRYEGLAEAAKALSQRLRPSPPLSTLDHAPVAAPPVGGSEISVTVIVRTFNRPHLLSCALADLSRQTYRPFEVLVVNDGETPVDASIEPFAASLPVRLVPHEAGGGRSVALNSGLAAARGDLITYLDDDDRVFPGHIAALVNGFGAEGVDVVYTVAARVLCWSDLRRDEPLEALPCVSREFDRNALLVDNWIPLMTFMHRRSCVDAVGSFDPTLDLCEDWDFLIRLAANCRFRHAPVLTCEYRYRFGPIADRARSALRERGRVLEATETIYRRYPVSDGKSRAQRALTLQALKRDIYEVGWIEKTTAEPLLRDLRVVAWIGRFPRIDRYIASLRDLRLA